jgi:transcriptional regulator with XRE-family HTH domain
MSQGNLLEERMAKRARKSSGRMASQGFPNPIDVHVGARIMLRRTLLGISQLTLAEAMGLSFQQIQKYEKGANRVSSSRLVDMANALDVSVSYFFEEMTAAVQKQTPSALMITKQRPEIGREKDPMARRETLQLVRAYYRIEDPAVRKRLRELIGAVSSRSGQ